MWLLLVGLFIVALDQFLKYLVIRTFEPGHSIQIIDGFFNLTRVHNPGAAFGLFADWRAFFLVFSIITIIAIFVIALRYARNKPVLQILLGLVLGGACGNLIDRIRFGYVIDFLDFYLFNYHWPAFNIADSSICIGIGILTIFLLKVQQHTE